MGFKRLVLALFIVLFGISLAGCGGGKKETAKEEAAKEPIVVGVWGTLTGPDSNVNGMTWGTYDYFNYLNEFKGGIDGHPVKAIIADGKYQLEEEFKIFNRLVDVEKAVVINGWSTGATKALREQVNNVVKVPFVSETMTGEVVDPKKYPYIFTLGPTYEDQIKIAFKYAKEKGAKKVAFLHNDAEYGTACVVAVKNEKFAESIGLEVVADVSYPMASTDLTSQLLTIKNANPDYVYIQDSVNNIIAILRAANKVGMKPELFIGNFYGLSQLIIDTLGSQAEGFHAQQVFLPFGSDIPAMKQINEWSSKHKIEKQDQYYMKGWAEGILIEKAIAEALKETGSKAPPINEFRTLVRNKLEGLTNVDIGGIAQPVTYANHKGVVSSQLLQIKGGKYVPVTDWIKTE